MSTEYRQAYADALYGKAQSGERLTEGEADYCRDHGLRETLRLDDQNRLRMITKSAPSVSASTPIPSTRDERTAEIIVHTVQKSIAPLIAAIATREAEIATLRTAIATLTARQDALTRTVENFRVDLEADRVIAAELDRVDDD
jgi:hypothetical protein